MIRTKALDQQSEALSLSLESNSFAFFMDMGTGKTLTALFWVYYKSLHNVLLILRNDDFMTWKDHIDNYTSFDFIDINESIDKKDAALRLRCDARFKIVGYGSVEKYKHIISKIDFDGVICDESTKLKHSNTTRYRALYSATRQIKHRAILTGTPTTNTIDNLFGQIKFLDDGFRLGKTINAFKSRYYFQADTYVYILKADTVKDVMKKISDISYTIKSEECIELPSVRKITHVSKMYSLQKKYYSQLEKKWEVDFPDKSTMVEYVISKISKYLQISSGFFYDNDDELYKFKSGKVDDLIEIVSDRFSHKKKIVIWCTFTEEIFIVRDAVKKYGQYVLFYGGVNSSDRISARKNFYSNDSIRFFICQVGCGVGMNELVKANLSIYFSHDWKLESYLQSMKRTLRIGSEHHKNVTYISIISKGSFDGKILKCLQSNQKILNEIMDGRIQV